MQISHLKSEVLRRTNAEDIKVIWECIRSSKIQKQLPTLDKLVKTVSKELNLNEDDSKRLVLNVESDGLIERTNSQGVKGVNNNLNGSFNSDFMFTLPDFTKPLNKDEKDWYCFICHLSGEIISCEGCFRSFHLNCFKENYFHKSNNRFINNRSINKSKSNNSDKFLCYICESKTDNPEYNLTRKQIRKLLDFATHFIRKKPAWKDMLTIGFRGEIVKNEYLVYRYCDLELIQRKIKDGRYQSLTGLVDDADNFVHCVCILHGIYSDKADQARVLLREIKDEINEVQLCSDCYINAKAKLAEWITKPCNPNHKLIWAKQSGSQYYWPAKVLIERNEGYEVRFFGMGHERSFIKKYDTKSFQYRPEDLEIKPGSNFDRAWTEVKKLREKVEQGYYTHSSGESDLPDTEEEYSDEIYLSERRNSGLSIVDHHLANGGNNYSLLSTLSSRRSTALERSRKTSGGPPNNTTINGKLKRTSSDSITSKTKPVKSKKRLSSRSGIGAPVTKRMARNSNITNNNSNNNNNIDKSISSYKSTSGRSSKNKRNNKNTDDSDDSDDGSDSSDDNSNDSEKSSSSSENIKSLNYKFSPKSSILRSPAISGAITKSLRQNRKPSAKLSQLSASRYTSLSDRIKMDLSSTESSEYDPKDNSSNKPATRKRTRKKSANQLSAPSNLSNISSQVTSTTGVVPGSALVGGPTIPNSTGRGRPGRKRKSLFNTTSVGPTTAVVAPPSPDLEHSSSSSSSSSSAEDTRPGINHLQLTGPASSSSRNNPASAIPSQHKHRHNINHHQEHQHNSGNESTDRCCSPDINPLLAYSPIFRSSSASSSLHKLQQNQQQQHNQRLAVNIPPNSPRHRQQDPTTNTNTSVAAGAAANANTTAASSSSVLNNNNNNMSSAPSSALSTATGITPTQRQKINSPFNNIFLNQPLPKRMVHKCVATTMPVCNCQEKFDKRLEEEKSKLQREHQLLIVELEKKLKLEFEDNKTQELKKATDEIRNQMQLLIDKEKSSAQETLAIIEAKHNEAVTNTKRRQWCRNCLKEAIYHCCWNTSYCSIQCQQEHWQKEHKRVCRRKR